MALPGRAACWPTSEQLLLLRAALLPGAAGVRAWAELRPRLDLDRLDGASVRMLPLLAHNLGRLGIRDPVRARLAGVHRHSWASVQRLLHLLSRVLERLHVAGIPTLVLKGAALARQYYPDVGLRPMSDVDVMVPEPQATRAMEVLQGAGFVPIGLHPNAARPQDTILVRHAHAFRSPDGGEVDLHWHVLWECASSGLDADLWERAVPLRIGSVTTRALCPSDQLLQVCVHGARWNPVPTFRWLADVVFILGTPGPGVDWYRVVELGRRLGVVLPLRDSLAVVRRDLGAAVPPEVLGDLGRLRVPAWQRIEYALQVRAPTLLSPLWLHALHHWRQQRHGGLLRAAWRFPGYLARTFELEGTARLPRFLLGELARRARRLERRPAPEGRVGRA